MARALGVVGHTRIHHVSHNLPDGRCYRLAGPGAPGSPSAGADIDGVTGIFNIEGWGGVPPTTPPPAVPFILPAVPGNEVQVEAAAAFSAGALLATTADGRVQTAGTGQVAVLRALQSASGAGVLVWAVFTSGR